MVLEAVHRSVVPSQSPQTPFRADQQFIAGWMNGVNIVGFLRQLSVDARVDIEAAVFNEIIVQVQLVKPGGRAKPQGLGVGRRRSVKHHGSDFCRIVV